MRTVKTESLLQFPDTLGIKDEAVKKALKDLAEVLYRSQRKVHDDLMAMQNVDVDVELPTAAEEYRGRLLVLDGGAGVADKAYICLKQADGTFAWKEAIIA